MRLFPLKAHKACENCQFGHRAAGGDRILCRRKGVVSPDYSCRKYQYDPLKRVPKRLPPLPDFRPEDFKL